MSEPGIKYDEGKPDWALLPFKAVEDVVQVMTFGAKKYAKGNWKHIEDPQRYLSAAMRHVAAYQDGEDLDPESHLPHLAHATCSLLFLHWHEHHKPEH